MPLRTRTGRVVASGSAVGRSGEYESPALAAVSGARCQPDLPGDERKVAEALAGRKAAPRRKQWPALTTVGTWMQLARAPGSVLLDQAFM
jgi:hypothetical protein